MVDILHHSAILLIMALNLKNPRVEELATRVAEMTGETKTEAIRKALEQRHQRLTYRLAASSKGERLRALLNEEIWPQIPEKELGRRLSKDEEEDILGLSGDGS